MYESFYGFTQKPFQISPDAEFYFDAAPHRKAMAYLHYGLDRKEGFVLVTGDAGTGKTTLVNRMLAGLDGGESVAAIQASFSQEAEDLLRTVASAFGISTKNIDRAELPFSIEIFLTSAAQRGKRCLLVVDEAQNLSSGALEALRMLSNFQLGQYALLQSLLFGESGLRRAMQGAGLRQRVIAACHIGPLDADETRQYIGHRLKFAGLQGGLEIQGGAYRGIYEASGGVARRVNSLCDRILLSGFLAESRLVTAADVNRVAAEVEQELSGLEAERDASDASADHEMNERSCIGDTQ